MVIFEDFEADEKKKLAVIWKAMSPQDRDHFINQAALSMAVWGGDEKGKAIIVELMRNMLADGSKNLADFGLYLEFLDEKAIKGREEKMKKTLSVLDNYRFKHDLPSEPTRDFLFNEKS